jgi:predicted Kef-type K+ transport protein
MLLMFGVGLHFSLDDLLSVKKIALPGAVVQIAVATAMGMGLAHWWGWCAARRGPRRWAGAPAQPICPRC